MKVTILGCGSAGGVPNISVGWGKCDPANPKNRRRRASILVEDGPTRILVDTSPDLREQLIDANVRHLDAVLFTHGHADHIHGIDDIREICRVTRAPLPIYATPETMQILETRFGYVFKGIPPGSPIFRPWLVPNLIAPTETFSIGTIKIRPFPQDHGFGAVTMGFDFGGIIYSTDVVQIPEISKPFIAGTKVWIVDALADMPFPTHATLDQALAWIAELKPHRAVLTHMSNALDYDTMMARLPVGVTPAYDGMVIEV